MSRQRSHLRNRLEYAGYRAARAVARWSGPRRLAWLGARLGDLYLATGRRRRAILRYNLALAFPHTDAAGRRRLERMVSRHFGRVTLDALRLQRLAPGQLMAEVAVRGRDHLEEALALGRGVFLLSAHIGSWEVAALAAGLLVPGGFAVVNRPLDNPLLEAELDRLRSLFGNRALGKENVTRGMLRQLKGGGAVGILIDQRTQQHEGVRVPFFGHPAWTHPALARLALRTGAPVVPIWGLWDAPGNYTVRFDTPVRVDLLPSEARDEVALTARFTALIEGVIRERPEQWLWYHDRWRELRLQDDGTGKTRETQSARPSAPESRP